MYNSGIFADGCWNQLDEYDKEAIERLVLETVNTCIAIVDTAVQHREPASTYTNKLKQYFYD